jgi:tripartite-type tricarboxylate transporter receptor subunit TctC
MLEACTFDLAMREDEMRASICATAALMLLCTVVCHAQNASTADEAYPTRPVRIVVPFAAGGPGDLISRLIAQKLSEGLGKQFYVENQGGAGGNIGMGMVARAPADGYTIMIASSTFMINPSLYGKVPYDPIKDFDPVTIAATTPNLLVVHPSVPAATVAQLVELVRNGTYRNYATPGAGTPSHLSGELFKFALKLDLTAVPFHGGGPMIQSVLGGHTPLAFSSLPPAAPLLRDGALRALAVTTARRVSLLPDVPTLEEAGYPGQEGDTPQCVLVPAGTPRTIVERLHGEILRIIALPEVKEKFAAIGFEPIGTTPEEFAARIKVDVPKWAKIVREANIKVD